MKATQFLFRGAMFGAAAVILFGCAGAKPYEKKMPDWINQGSGAFKKDGKEAFYGVGAVTSVKNQPLATTAAENRARAEITKIFETYTASLMKDYASSTAGGAAINRETPTTEEQYIEQAVKTFSAATLSGVEIIDHWNNPSDDTLYALARLDVDKFKNNLEKIKELNAEARDYIRKNADKAFEDLSKEEEKRGM
jgi:LPP20 lipoprotein